jgi:hypothetical protein
MTALIAALAASGTTCGNVTPEMMLTAEQGCQAEAHAICGALQSCATFWVQLVYGDEPTCESRLSMSCLNDQMVAGTTRTPADLSACAQAVMTTSCSDLVASKFPTACQVKPGTVANGQPCGSDWQCQSTYCNTAGATCGVCGPRAGVGGSCTSDDSCTTGLVCANSKCVTPGQEAATCDPTNQPCRSDLYCNNNGLCLPHVGVGGSCSDTDRACDLYKGTACNPLTKTCDMIGVAQGGGACGIVNRTLTLCVALDGCTNNICASPAQDGQACGDANSGHNCISPSTCVAGVCQFPGVTSCP